jgi:hypothetical protein
LRHGFELTNPPNPKFDKKILLVMPGDQAERVIRHKPDPLADTYVFEGEASSGAAWDQAMINSIGELLDKLLVLEKGNSK